MSGVGAFKVFNAVILKVKVSNSTTWVDNLVPGDYEEKLSYFIRYVALGLVISGFESLKLHCCCLVTSDLRGIADTPVAKEVLHRLIIKVTEQYLRKYLVNLCKSLSSVSPSKLLTREPVKEISSMELVGFLTVDMVKFIVQRAPVECGQKGFPVFSTLKPTQCNWASIEAESLCADISCILVDKVTMVKMSSAKDSLASIAPGLRCGDAFAVALLDFPLGSTVPPRSDLDVVSGLAIFISVETARSPLCSIDWGCRFFGLYLCWWSALVFFKHRLKLSLTDLKDDKQFAKVFNMSAAKIPDRTFVRNVLVAWLCSHSFAESKAHQGEVEYQLQDGTRCASKAYVDLGYYDDVHFYMLMTVIIFAWTLLLWGALWLSGHGITKRKMSSSVTCQSQCTYRRDLATPRFQVLSLPWGATE
jgi:hypothetical protein